MSQRHTQPRHIGYASLLWEPRKHKVFLHKTLYARTLNVLGQWPRIKDTSVDRFTERVCKKKNPVENFLPDPQVGGSGNGTSYLTRT